MRELLPLLNDASRTDFRGARRPMGFTQRRAAAKFTRDEAAAFLAPGSRAMNLKGLPGGSPCRCPSGEALRARPPTAPLTCYRNTTTLQYNSAGQVTSETDPMARTTTWS